MFHAHAHRRVPLLVVDVMPATAFERYRARLPRRWLAISLVIPGLMLMIGIWTFPAGGHTPRAPGLIWWFAVCLLPTVSSAFICGLIARRHLERTEWSPSVAKRYPGRLVKIGVLFGLLLIAGHFAVHEATGLHTFVDRNTIMDGSALGLLALPIVWFAVAGRIGWYRINRLLAAERRLEPAPPEFASLQKPRPT
jgi:hypothetical protein